MQSKTSEYPVYLDSINQNTRVKIDEKGVTAASYIELNFDAGAAEPPDEIIDFVLDRPFVFVVSREQIPPVCGYSEYSVTIQNFPVKRYANRMIGCFQ